MINATPTQLRKAADIQEKIQSLQEELGQLLGGSDETAAIEAPRKKGKMSARGLANIRAGVAKRMAAQGKAPKRKRKMTDAWRKALERAWAARRAKAKKAG